MLVQKRWGLSNLWCRFFCSVLLRRAFKSGTSQGAFAPAYHAPSPQTFSLPPPSIRQAYRNSIVVGEDRHVSVWSLCKGQRPRLERACFCEHQRPIRRLELTGRWIVTCSGDYVIRLWDSKTGACIRDLGVSKCCF